MSCIDCRSLPYFVMGWTYDNNIRNLECTSFSCISVTLIWTNDVANNNAVDYGLSVGYSPDGIIPPGLSYYGYSSNPNVQFPIDGNLETEGLAVEHIAWIPSGPPNDGYYTIEVGTIDRVGSDPIPFMVAIRVDGGAYDIHHFA